MIPIAKKFQRQNISAVLKNGKPWYVAKDVCRVLEIKNHKAAIKSLDPDQKDGVDITDPIGRQQQAHIINKSGANAFKSRKPKQAISVLDKDQKDDVQIMDTIGRLQKTNITNKSGAYALAFKSKKPEEMTLSA